MKVINKEGLINVCKNNEFKIRENIVQTDSIDDFIAMRCGTDLLKDPEYINLKKDYIISFNDRDLCSCNDVIAQLLECILLECSKNHECYINY